MGPRDPHRGAALLLAGCASSVDLTATSPSATSQLLVFRALERAVADLDLTRLRGRRVALEVISQLCELGQEKEPKFAAAYLETWLRATGVDGGRRPSGAPPPGCIC